MAPSSNAADLTAELKERYSRQIILPGVGIQGQQKWVSAQVVLAAEGTALEGATTALTTAGLPRVTALAGPADEIAQDAWVLVLTQKKDLRRALSRRFRSEGRPAFFGWAAGSGWALSFFSHKESQCPCLECFEMMNPKAFNEPAPGVPRLMAVMAVSEVLQYILEPKSPLEGKVWITSLDSGVSFLHEVTSTYKCPARLAQEGAPVTP